MTISVRNATCAALARSESLFFWLWAAELFKAFKAAGYIRAWIRRFTRRRR
ncbi:MAG: hypothetical protein IJV91_08095 [Kiritimatiellae bacterium]|nr:hypothetical protein [Kiritimatiellia bacterium]